MVVIIIFICLFVVIIIIIITYIFKKYKQSKKSDIENLLFQPLYPTDGALNNKQKNDSSSQKYYMPQNQPDNENK